MYHLELMKNWLLNHHWQGVFELSSCIRFLLLQWCRSITVHSFFLWGNYFQLSSSRSNGFNPSKDTFKPSAGLPVQSALIRAPRIESQGFLQRSVLERRKKEDVMISPALVASRYLSAELSVLAPNHSNSSLQLMTRIVGKQTEIIGSWFRW